MSDGAGTGEAPGTGGAAGTTEAAGTGGATRVAGTGGATGVAGTISAADLSLLAAELGELAASVDGVVHVRARPGFGTVVRSALQGLSAVVGGGGVAGTGAEASVPDVEKADPSSLEAAAQAAPGRPVPLVGIAVADLETRITLDIAVDESGSSPLVARAVAQALLDRVSGEPLPPASVDLRIVSVATGS